MRSPAERVLDAALATLAAAALAVLYAPVVIGALFSVVTVDRTGIHWGTATFAWYGRLLDNPSILAALRTTAAVGVLSVAAAAALAVLLALYVDWRGAILPRAIEVVVYLPFLMPPIVTGLALLVGSAALGIDRGLGTLVVGHAAFVLGILFRLVRNRLETLSPSLAEASADLGASRLQTLRFVLWPHLRSAVATGAILAFTLSFDETLISVFLAGDATTLPLRLWGMMRVGFTPEINALVTVVLLLSIALAVLVGARMRPAGDEEGT